MLKPVVITLTESDEETNTADEFEDDMSSYNLHALFRYKII